MYEGGSVTLEAIKNEKDIGVTMDMKLQFEGHIHIQIKKSQYDDGNYQTIICQLRYGDILFII